MSGRTLCLAECYVAGFFEPIKAETIWPAHYLAFQSGLSTFLVVQFVETC